MTGGRGAGTNRLVVTQPLRTSITLILEHADAELAEAHWELYPERVGEQIPLSLTLLYPWIPAEAVTDGDVDGLRSFLAERRPLAFDLVRLAELRGIVVYAVPEPDDELRALMHALWTRYPEYPPYGRPGADPPPPHATLGRAERERDDAITLEQAENRVGHLLPVHCDVREVTLMEEHAPGRWRIRDRFALGSRA